jgi:hypothetical protein
MMMVGHEDCTKCPMVHCHLLSVAVVALGVASILVGLLLQADRASLMIFIE